MLYPRFTFGAIQGVEDFSFALSRGVSPSLATVSILPNVPLDRKPKTMVISDGDRTVNFPLSQIIDVTPEIDSSGRENLLVSIVDRRWIWSFPRIAGEYNVERGGKIVEPTRRSVRQLGKLLLEKLGERKFDISALPDDRFPYVNWDFELAAPILEQLCQDHNCHVCLGTDNQVRVWRDGVGNELPKVPSSSASVGYDFGIQPVAIGCVSSPVVWEVDLRLLPVGEESSGELREASKLSYTPKKPLYKHGWLSVNPASAAFAVDKKYERAASTLFRYYRLEIDREEESKRYELPEAKGLLKYVSQLLPVLDYRLETKKVETESIRYPDEKETTETQLDPVIWGVFNDGSGLSGPEGNNVTKGAKFDGVDGDPYKCSYTGSRDLNKIPDLIYPDQWEIDNDRGIVIFADPVYANRSANRVSPSIVWPCLFLRVAVRLHELETHAPYRLAADLQIDRTVPKNELLTDWDVKEEIEPTIRYDFAQKKIISNVKESRRQLEYYVRTNISKYAVKNPASGNYPYLLPYAPDGKIAQVVFSIDSQGFIGTSVHKEIEGLNNIVDYTERREQLARLLAVEQQKRDRNKRPAVKSRGGKKK